MQGGVSRVDEHALDPVPGNFVLLAGLRETRGALGRWRRNPGEVLGGWFAGGMLTAVALLAATWLAASSIQPDLTPIFIPGINVSLEPGDYVAILAKNGLVLALHATACVAGFIAGSSLPLAAEQMTGFRRFIHERAGPVAIAWVVAVTTFSLVAQALALGFDGATLARQFEISPGVLILTVLPHALVELLLWPELLLAASPAG